MTINEMIEKEILEYLQKKWNTIKRFDERGIDCENYVDGFNACLGMAKHLTGKRMDVNADDEVYIVED